MRTGITSIDVVIIVLYLIAVLGLGLFFAFRTKNSDDFLLGGRRMPSWSIGLSLFATVLSTISFLAWPGEIIRHGPTILCQLIAYPTAFVIVGWFLIPLIMRQPVTSAYEILETRLGPSVRYLASTIFLVLRLLWMSVVMYATVEKIIIPVLQLPEWAAPWVCVGIGTIAVIYTSLGGLKAVVATDVVQAVILLSAAVATLVLITYRLGGIDGWWPTTWSGHWSAPRVWFHSHDRSVLGFLLTMVTWYVAMAGSDQMAIQRYLATRDVKAARRALGIAWSVEACAFFLMAMIGLALLAWFTVHTEWLLPGESVSETPDRLFPRFIVNGLPVGITGLVVAALMGAAMASLASGMNSSSAVITSDFLEGALEMKLSTRGRLIAVRASSAIVGIVVVLLATAVRAINTNLYELTVRVANLMTGSLFVVFFVAFFVPRATPLVAWIAAITAMTIAVTIAFFPDYHGLGFLWITPGSLFGGAAAALLAAAVLGRPRSGLQPATQSDAAVGN
jgi:SSS family solute:Na+ symporter